MMMMMIEMINVISLYHHRHHHNYQYLFFIRAPQRDLQSSFSSNKLFELFASHFSIFFLFFSCIILESNNETYGRMNNCQLCVGRSDNLLCFRMVLS